jgi:hypothetical protein
MNVCNADIDEKVIDYIDQNHGKVPRFVLLDKKSHEDLSKTFIAKERIMLLTGDSTAPGLVTKIWCQAGCQVRILTVEIDCPFFEVVG